MARPGRSRCSAWCSPCWAWSTGRSRPTPPTPLGWPSPTSLRRPCWPGWRPRARVALPILSVHVPSALSRILATDDVDALTLVPGIGKKTAARLLIELKAKLDIELDGESFAVAGTGLGAAPVSLGPRAEVRAALASLGYTNDEIRDAVAGLPEDGDVS